MPAACATESEIAAALDCSVRYALETMCFAEAVPAPSAVEHVKYVTVAFRAGFAGTLEIAATPAAAQRLASALLGLQPGEAPGEAYVDDTLCELATTICGRFLSSLDASACLRLEQARLETKSSAAPPDLQLGFQVERGEMTVSLRFD
ncbi:MAG TPA: chemotaxis protein CheX [Bryobacteraceae bacterium]